MDAGTRTVGCEETLASFNTSSVFQETASGGQQGQRYCHTTHKRAHTHTHNMQHASQLQQVEAAQAINLHSLVVHRTVIIQLPAHKTMNQPISTGRGLSKYCSALADRK